MTQMLESNPKPSKQKNQLIERIRQAFKKKVTSFLQTQNQFNNSDRSIAKLEYFLSMAVKNPIDTISEVGWINQNQLVLTLNNEFYLVNLKHKDLIKVKNDIKYGRQQLNMNLFCSIVQKTN